ncbi:MAG: EamA family transporter [Bacteroidota bacterium]
MLSSKLQRLPPHVYFVISAIFHYLGPSFAVLLFAKIPVDGVAWMRIVAAALIFAAWRRPFRTFSNTNKNSKLLIIGLGIIFALMNYSFYFAISYLPLGTVAGIEFLGPIAVAIVSVKNVRNYIALAFTSLGVYLLTDVRLEGDAVGFMWAFLNMLLFTAYILLAHRLTMSDPKTKAIDRLAISMLFASVTIFPLGFKSASLAFTEPLLLLAGIGVGISSSVIPYALDQLAMAKLSPAIYSIMIAILPAMAFFIGFLVLGQQPQILELIALASIIIGLLITKR